MWSLTTDVCREMGVRTEILLCRHIQVIGMSRVLYLRIFNYEVPGIVLVFVLIFVFFVLILLVLIFV